MDNGRDWRFERVDSFGWVVDPASSELFRYTTFDGNQYFLWQDNTRENQN